MCKWEQSVAAFATDAISAVKPRLARVGAGPFRMRGRGNERPGERPGNSADLAYWHAVPGMRNTWRVIGLVWVTVPGEAGRVTVYA